MKDVAFFCPACGTPSVKTSELSGGEASCELCSWTGTREELLSLPLEHAFESKEDMLMTFVKQLSKAVAQSGALEIGKVLLQWGFLDKKSMTTELGIFIKVMAIAATKAALEARHHIERARSKKAVSHDN